MATVRNAVNDFADRHAIPNGITVAVALSGGSDSFALAAATGFVAHSRHWRVLTITIDHGLQSGSSTIATRVASLAAGIPGIDATQVERVTVGREGGPEAAARTARYDALDRIARQTGASAIFLGHTLNDQAETTLLGLARGSGPNSLHGMNERDDLYCRPLLKVDRNTTRAAADAMGIEVWDDPHNDDTRFARVRVRHIVIPTLEREIGPGIVDALARTAELLREDDEALDMLAENIAKTILEGGAVVSFAVGDVQPHPRALRTRIIRIAASRAWKTSLSYAHTRAIDSLIADWHGQGPIDVSGGSVVRRHDRIVFGPASEV